MSEPMKHRPEINPDDMDYLDLRDAYRRSRIALCRLKAQMDEVTREVLDWWDEHNDGQNVPEFVRIALRYTGEDVP